MGLVANFCQYLAERGNSVTTIACYRSDLKDFFRTTGLPDEDTAEICQAAALELKKYRIRAARSLMAETVNRKLSVLRTFFRWSQETHRIDQQTVPLIDQVPAEKHKSRTVRVLSRGEQARLLEVVEHSNEARAYALLSLMLHTGIRISEIRRLHWSDVRIEGSSGTICVRSSKSGRELILPLDAMTTDALCVLRETVEYKAGTPVFPGRSGPLTRSQIVNVLSRYFSAAGIKDPKPEMLRASFEANMIDQGIDPFTLAYQMGYSRLGCPQKRYSEIREVLDRDAKSRKRV